MAINHVASLSARKEPPVTITATAITANTSTAAVILNASDQFVNFTGGVDKAFIIFGTSAVTAATVSHYPVPIDAERSWYVSADSGITHFRVISVLASTLTWFVEGD